jgi:Peptidase C13 family/YcxB-like protein
VRETYSYALTPEQYSAAVIRRGRQRFRGAWRSAGVLFGLIFYAAAGLLLTSAIQRRSVPSSLVLSAVIVLLVSIALAQWVSMMGVRRALRRSSYMVAPRTLHLEAGGIRQRSDKDELFHAWSGISGAEIHGELLYLDLDAVHFYPIPLAAFASGEEARDFAAFVNEHAKGASPQAAHSPAVDIASPPVLRRDRIAGEIALDALRLALFRPVPADRPRSPWSVIFLVTMLGLAIPVLWAVRSVGFEGEWNWYSLSSALLHIPLLLAASIAAGYALGRPAEVPRLFMAGLLICVVADLAGVALTMVIATNPVFMQISGQFAWLPAAWIALALATYACRQIEPGVRRLGIVAVCIVFLALPLGNIYRDREMWHAPYNPDESEGPRQARHGAGEEDVFYKQPALLAQELQSVRPGRKGVIDVFFIGMAGYGMQDVFRREVDSVAQLLRDRFGAEGHVVRLVNNSKTLLDMPIASMTSLRAALKRVAEVMDKDEDVLVLYMTSHGSEDHRFSLALWPLTFHELDPKALREALDESGIRNRVVIIAACYSGGFVKPLESPDTLVITASAADRTSFGCSNEAEWTYFGKAYFDEALRRTHSFTKAFEIAKPLIAEREKKDKYDPSNPQMSLGTAIAGKLDELEKQLEGNATDPLAGRIASEPKASADPFDEYVRLMFPSRHLADLRKTCDSSMQLMSPSEVVSRRPDAFDGMQNSPRHWKPLTAAWNRYVEAFCSEANDPVTLRDAYGKKVRSLMTEKDVRAALAFLKSEAGARWSSQEHEATRQRMIEMGRSQAELSERLYNAYVAEQTRLFEDFRGGAKK